MFGIGWTEMLVLGVVALIVIGPKDLPVVMNRLGKMVNSVRRMGSEFQRELNKASGLDQITDLRRSITAPLKQTADEIRKEFNKPTASGGFEPTGIVKPKDPNAESVVDEIHEKIGVPVKQPYVPFTKEAQDKYRKEQMAEAVTKAVAEKSAAKPAPSKAQRPRGNRTARPRSPARRASPRLRDRRAAGARARNAGAPPRSRASRAPWPNPIGGVSGGHQGAPQSRQGQGRRRAQGLGSAAARSSDRAAQAPDLFGRGDCRHLHRLLRFRAAALQRADAALRVGGRWRRERADDHHVAAGAVLHQHERRPVRRAVHRLSVHRDPDLPLRRAGPLQEGTQRLHSVPHRDAALLPCRRGDGLFRVSARWRCTSSSACSSWARGRSRSNSRPASANIWVSS